MRILITGGAGFLGSHLCDHFIRKGYRVLAIDNLSTSPEKMNIRHLIGHRHFSFQKQDVSKAFSVSGQLNFILHFASPASPVDYINQPLETMRVGSRGTENLLDIAREKRAVFLLASTSEVYGDPDPFNHPQNENYWGNVNPIGPRSVYDEAKRFAEAMTMAYSRKKLKVETRIVRIFNTYGQRMRLEDGRVIPNFITQALRNMPLTVYGQGQQTRSYCYINDLVAGVEKALHSKYSLPINLGNPNEKSVLELAHHIIRITRSKSKVVYRPLPEDDPKQRCPDITLAKRVLKWEPKVSLETGLPLTIDYFKSALAKRRK